jgi:hypothetical protein
MGVPFSSKLVTLLWLDIIDVVNLFITSIIYTTLICAIDIEWKLYKQNGILRNIEWKYTYFKW